MSETAFKIWKMNLQKKLANLLKIPKNSIKLENFSKSNFREEFEKNKTTKEVAEEIENSFRGL